MAEESTRHNFTVTATLAVVCSLLVSVTAIGLSDRKEANRELDRKRNILAVAGLYDDAVPVDEAFEAIETRLIDLETGAFVEEGEAPEGYDQRLALSSPTLSEPVPADEDDASGAPTDEVLELTRDQMAPPLEEPDAVADAPQDASEPSSAATPEAESSEALETPADADMPASATDFTNLGEAADAASVRKPTSPRSRRCSTKGRRSSSR